MTDEQKELEENEVAEKEELPLMNSGYKHQKRLQRKMRSWVIAQDADYFVTLTFNKRSLSVHAAQKYLKQWHARIDRKLLGKHWAKAAVSERLFFVAFIEKIDSNPHWHLAVKLADDNRVGIFEALAEKCWTKVVKSGTLDVQKNNTQQDVLVTGLYSAKDIWKQRNYENAVIS